MKKQSPCNSAEYVENPETIPSGTAGTGRSPLTGGRPRFLEELATPEWEPDPMQTGQALARGKDQTSDTAAAAEPSEMIGSTATPIVISVVPGAEQSLAAYSHSSALHAGASWYAPASDVDIPGRHPRFLRVAVYCRVSTDLESQENSFFGQQAHYLEQIRRNERWSLAGMYCEQGVSGTGKEKRPGLRSYQVDLPVCEKYVRTAFHGQGADDIGCPSAFRKRTDRYRINGLRVSSYSAGSFCGGRIEVNLRKCQMGYPKAVP